MFKKKPTIKALAPLRSSDRRKLADQIINEYKLEPESAPNGEQSPEQKAEATASRSALRNSLLPDNTQSARFTTTHGPDLKQVSGTVYVGSHGGEEGRILWFQLEGRIYPTVYTLWRQPDLVALLHTPGIVIKKLQGGADLMTPGLAGGPPFPQRAVEGAVVAVASTEKPSVPVAVGWCEIEVAKLEKTQGMKGRAVRNLHWTGDEAWSFGTSGRAGMMAPEELEGWTKVLESRGLVDKMQDLEIEDGEGGVDLTERRNEPDTADTNGHFNGSHDQDDVNDDTQEDEKELSQKEVDDAFWNAFLYGIYKHKTENSTAPNHGLVFPINQSNAMSNLIQPYLPAFTPQQTQQLQMKKTSWKNIKKFIKALDKAQILKSKEINGHETVIWDIDFEDTAFTSFKPYRLPKKDAAASNAQGRSETATEKTDTGGDPSIGQNLNVVSYYKPTTKLQPLFSAATKQLMTPPEIREIITSYLESENLVSQTNKRLINLNPILSNAVFDGSSPLDKEVLAKGSVPRDALIDRILHAMSPAYAIVRNGDEAGTKAKSGTPPKINITLETRSGNKMVTKISGLENYFINPKLLADELRKVCAGATSVEPLAGANKKNERVVEEVMVQGPQKDAVVKTLERRGVDKRWVEVFDKGKGKKR